MRRHGTVVLLNGDEYAGPILVDPCGVHVDVECQMRVKDSEEWEALNNAGLIPWHRVFGVDWNSKYV